MTKIISVIGLGYIGLPTAALIASNKTTVIGIDVDIRVVDTINSGKIHIVETDLEDLVAEVVGEGYLKATTIIESADIFLIAVPTPVNDNNEPDISYIVDAARALSPVLKKGDLVILESTSPVGTTEILRDILKIERSDLVFAEQGMDDSNNTSDVFIAYCPERVLPGQVLKELVENGRVIGGITKKCSEKAVTFYKSFVQGELVVTNSRTAEMTKLTENSFRDVNIAFANELSMICDKLDINVWELIDIANIHPRVNILKPGAGVGGHCIAVDPWFIVHSTPDIARLIRMARHVNLKKTEWVVNKIQEEIENTTNRNNNKIKIVFCGLSFKPDVDDLRESPSIAIVTRFFENKNLDIYVVEPNIDDLPKSLANQCILTTIDKALTLTDICVVLVDHKEFANLEYNEQMHVIDTRGFSNK
jgi:UDP-N-acetyl-D-mannosaminuronic acid dehydrogenase